MPRSLEWSLIFTFHVWTEQFDGSEFFHLLCWVGDNAVGKGTGICFNGL